MFKAILFIILGGIITTLFMFCHSDSPKKINYPVTKKGNVVDTIFATPVPDPYRWLEDDLSEETSAWVQEQNKVTFAYLEKIPYREQIRERLTKMWNYEKYDIPFRKGDHTYFAKNDGLQNQSVYYRQKDDGNPELFLDPNTFSADGTTTLALMEFSKDGSIVAYSISEGGSDRNNIILMDANSKEIIGDTLVDLKNTWISWWGNDGFYYTSYDMPKGNKLSTVADQHKLYYHKLGTRQAEDKIIFGADKKFWLIIGKVTEDNRYLIVFAKTSSGANDLYIKDLTRESSKFQTIISNTNSFQNIIDTEGSKLFIVTTLNAPNRRLVTVDAENPGPKNWNDIIPETENVLQPAAGAGYFFANYFKDGISSVKQYDRSGRMIREVILPGVGTAVGFRGKKDDKDIYYSFTNYTTPSIIYRMNPMTGETRIYKKPEVLFKSDDYVSEQVFYNSKDGTQVPMIITHKKKITLNRKNPTSLYGYGGFGVSIEPAFDISTALWLEMGGIFAVPNIRGGGEYGEKWHLAGTKMNKQNVFDDFISAAEYLIDNKYTSPEYLEIQGVSNGGLLMGAIITQRPDLFKVAHPRVGVLDMLRYHKFTMASGWASEYGTSEESPEMFKYLLEYSPVQNVKEGIEYPATLIQTADHDDRVVPAHSYKFTAHLQDKQTSNNPILIRVETNVGHGAGTPVSKAIEQFTDIFSFTLWNMGIKKLKN